MCLWGLDKGSKSRPRFFSKSALLSHGHGLDLDLLSGSSHVSLLFYKIRKQTEKNKVICTGQHTTLILQQEDLCYHVSYSISPFLRAVRTAARPQVAPHPTAELNWDVAPRA